MELQNRLIAQEEDGSFASVRSNNRDLVENRGICFNGIGKTKRFTLSKAFQTPR